MSLQALLRAENGGLSPCVETKTAAAGDALAPVVAVEGLRS
jgi:hypothetical protein